MTEYNEKKDNREITEETAPGPDHAAERTPECTAEQEIRPEDRAWLEERTRRNRNLYGVEINPDDPFGLKDGWEEAEPAASQEDPEAEEQKRKVPGMKTNVFFDLFEDYGNIVVPVIAVAAVLIYLAVVKFHLF